MRKLCAVMGVGKSAYYAWRKRPAAVICADALHIRRRMKALFSASRGSLGYRRMRQQLNEEGFIIGHHRVRKLMHSLGLRVKQRTRYKSTTQRNYQHRVAVNLLNQNFNPVGSNEVWAGDVTYVRTDEGWMYLAIVMDLFSRKIVGWHLDKRMTTDLVSEALKKASHVRQPSCGLVFHSDRGSQYTKPSVSGITHRIWDARKYGRCRCMLG